MAGDGERFGDHGASYVALETARGGGMVPPDDVSQTQTAAGEGVLRGLGLEPYPAAANTTTGTRGEATRREQGWEMMHDALRCPLSRERFVDPVVAGDGFSYERVHILAWIEEEGGEAATSPITAADDLSSWAKAPSLSCVRPWPQSPPAAAGGTGMHGSCCRSSDARRGLLHVLAGHPTALQGATAGGYLSTAARSGGVVALAAHSTQLAPVRPCPAATGMARR